MFVIYYSFMIFFFVLLVFVQYSFPSTKTYQDTFFLFLLCVLKVKSKKEKKKEDEAGITKLQR